jgi:hypothetical protein
MKITDFRVVYICPDHNEKYTKRKNHMDIMLQKMGFKDIVHYKSGTEKYPDCLSIATMNILKLCLDVPVLVLEDDVNYIDRLEFDFVEGADAIYFGLSGTAGHPTLTTCNGNAVFEHYSKNQTRVLNMLTSHAILFISRRYKEAVIDTMEACIKIGGIFNDLAISRIQKNYLVLANKIPTFYQSLEFNEEQRNNQNNVENLTKIEITDELYWLPITL